jgi:toxin ParE1/3/4
MNEPKLSDHAKGDLRQIWYEVASRRGVPAAKRTNAQILKKCRSHAQFPETGRLREDLGPGLRSFPSPPYVVFFRPAGGTIEILRVLHGRRDVNRVTREGG